MGQIKIIIRKMMMVIPLLIKIRDYNKPHRFFLLVVEVEPGKRILRRASTVFK